jgi:hypothetical protein
MDVVAAQETINCLRPVETFRALGADFVAGMLFATVFG